MKLISTILSAATLSSAAYAAPAGKFAANWATGDVELKPISGGKATELLAQIKPPGGKSLLIGLSGMVNILTTTAVTVSNKKGSRETATAEGSVDVTVKYAPEGTENICDDNVGEEAAPGTVTLSARRQELSAQLDLDCNITGGGTDLGCTVDGELFLSLEIDTTAAHHFNFIATDLDSIKYDVVACFDLSGSTTVTDDGVASGYVVIQKRMLTVQQVQVAQNGVIEPKDP